MQTLLKNFCQCDVGIICSVCRYLRLAHKNVKQDFGTNKLNRTKLSLLWYAKVKSSSSCEVRTFIPCGSPVWFVPAFIKLQLSTLAVAVQKALLGCHNFLPFRGTLLSRSLVLCKKWVFSAPVHDMWSDLHCPLARCYKGCCSWSGKS